MAGSPEVGNNSFLFFWFPTQFPVFMAGIALYRCAGRRLWTPGGLQASTMAVALAGAVLFGSIGLELGTAGNLDHGLAPTTMGVAFCGLAMGCRFRPIAAALINQATAWLGRISYSVYINHFAVLLALRFADKRLHILDGVPTPLGLFMMVLAALAISLPVSLLTRRLVEAPGIDLGHRLAVRLENRSLPGVGLAVDQKAGQTRHR
jgi:peptidoglycan/LPS O-acetylase OafA/YrhL